MKGKSTFSTQEIKNIKALIKLKLEANSQKQKGIRNKIRKIGFYYTDFYSRPTPFNNETFEALINSNRIKIK